ncbi:hypothetical protein BH11ARM1_BH11ARM1_02760 [soil metagenome]
MSSPLNASSRPAGVLFTSGSFIIPAFQREYSWSSDETSDLCQDLRNSLGQDSYFLGLVILVDDEKGSRVVDGQQRLTSISLVAIALKKEAEAHGRESLSNSIESTFLKYVDYDTDESKSRIVLTDSQDRAAYQHILKGTQDKLDPANKSLLPVSFKNIHSFIKEDIKSDPFKKLGKWAAFLTEKLYFAVFVHPDPSSAYQVFEVINTRGKELTTADLLKNYILSQVPPSDQESVYHRWQAITTPFGRDNSNILVQYIRHVVTLSSGHVLPKDLYAFLARRLDSTHGRQPPPVQALLTQLEQHLPLYTQMLHPDHDGPAGATALAVFRALNDINVIAVRPILLALNSLEDSDAGMLEVLKLVIKRVVVGTLGTGNVERRFSEAALRIHSLGEWQGPLKELRDLVPDKLDFAEQLRKRSYSKNMLEFLQRSLVQSSPTPDHKGVLKFVSSLVEDDDEPDVDFGQWERTIGNTVLFAESKIANPMPFHVAVRFIEKEEIGKKSSEIDSLNLWNSYTIREVGKNEADKLVAIWYA